MASGGPGKYRERKDRSNKPYNRPKGIIRRVTDSVTGLFSASWLTGWMGGDEDDDGNGSNEEQQPRPPPPPPPPPPTTLPPSGESFIFAQPPITTTTTTPARKTFKPFYPEEGETESNKGINEGASTSGTNTSTPPVLPTPTNTNTPVTGDGWMMGVTGRRLPVLSSTPNTTTTNMFTNNNATRTNNNNNNNNKQLEATSLPLLTTSTPTTGDDGSSDVSESSVDTGIDASVIPRPDERDYQREILQLDEESLQTLRDTLAKSVPTPPLPPLPPLPTTTTMSTTMLSTTTHTAILPTIEETRKRPRDLDQDHSSIRAEGSVSSKSLFSDMGDISPSQPQPSGLASKRPRFNVSMYGAPILDEKSVLSDSFKASPFYPGKTMYGGASAYRRTRIQTNTPIQQTTRTQVKPKSSEDVGSEDGGGLSQAARRILESLEQMSTPISDAKRMPTPTSGHRGSFLDHLPGSYRVAAYQHRHRRTHTHTQPPTAPLLTPTKVGLQANFATSLLTNNNNTTSTTTTKQQQTTTTTADIRGGGIGETETEEGNNNNNNGGTIPILKNNAIGNTASLGAFPSLPTTPSVGVVVDAPTFRFGLSGNTDEQQQQQQTPMIPFVPKPTTPSDVWSNKFSGKANFTFSVNNNNNNNNKRDTSGVNNGIANATPLFTFGSKENKLVTGTGFGSPVAPVPAAFGSKDSKLVGTGSGFGSPVPAFGSKDSKLVTGTGFGSPVAPVPAFGSKDSKLVGTGTGFGAPVTSTPTVAFGAPVPSTNTNTNTFQFGNSNPPVPAATPPTTTTTPTTAFGNPAFGGGGNSSNVTPAFGNNSASASAVTVTAAAAAAAAAAASGFAFGQSSEKKSSAGFDFGQAATNTTTTTTTQGFNFTQPTQPIFQFGQTQVNSVPAAANIFQFGSAGTEVATPTNANTAFGGGENPFSAAPPPSGRVVKKAVRRNRK
ncbi:hypothetical protein Pmani_012263 [Petrolisthes manimaculis]|uniref:Nucleoporin Nup153 N-terminal domain-containing protein n=1 Tax=Petrolisthes manimaculis TaxID=1843537 RepID=A0AAE1UAN2_9EUCA|nr:hypothetical protein Pmani_012263 [Petrolisthes manimaculis]